MSRNPILSPATIGGVILAGGRSRRMGGGDKCLAPLDGRPLLAHAIERLAPQVGPLVLSANGDPARFAAFGLPVIADGFPGFAGPLAGVLAGLDRAAGSGLAAVATVPADTPFFPEDMVARLAAAMARADAPAAVAATLDPERGPVPHPACALWSVALRADLRAALEGGTRRVLDFARAHGAAEATFPGDDRAFFNVNAPDDLRRAQALLAARAL